MRKLSRNPVVEIIGMFMKDKLHWMAYSIVMAIIVAVVLSIYLAGPVASSASMTVLGVGGLLRRHFGD